MKKLITLLYLFIPLFIVTGCTSQTPTAAPSTTVPTDPNAYPAPSNVASGYPAPAGGTANQSGTNVPSDPTLVPTADPELGAAQGVLLLQTGSEVEPVPDVLVYLAQIIQDDEGVERVASLDRSVAPKATTGENGEFFFINVEPGRYGLVLDIVVESFLLANPQDGSDLIVTIEPGVLYDFGELAYEGLPVPE